MLLNGPRRRGGKAWVWLVAGLLLGGAAGAGTMYVMHRGKEGIPGGPRLGSAKELAMVPGDAVGFVHFRARDAWNSPQLADFRKIVERAGPEAVAALDANFVPTPSSLDRITLVLVANPSAPPPGQRVGVDGTPVKPMVEPPNGVEPVGLLAFNTPFDAEKVKKALLLQPESKKSAGKEFWTDEGRDLALYFPAADGDLKGKVLAVGSVIGVTQFVAKQGGDGQATEGPLTRPATRASEGGLHFCGAVNLTRFRFNVDVIAKDLGNMIGSDANPLEMLQLAKDVAPLLSAQAIDVGFAMGATDAKFDLRAYFENDEAAAAGDKALRAAAAFGRKMLEKPRKDLELMVKGPPERAKPFPIDLLPQAAASLVGLGLLNTVDDFLANPPLKRDGSVLALDFDSPAVGVAGPVVAAGAVGAALLIPATQKVREAAARMSSQNNLKQIGLAMHNYHDSNGRLPSANGVTNGIPNPKAQLSWRVHLLPYIEQDNLYKQFNFNEPWDSPHNKALIPLMPKTYQSPNAPAPPGMTRYKVFVGGGAIFENGRGRGLFNITDGTSNTILVIEGGDPVTWTKPDDVPFDPRKSLPNLKVNGNARVSVAMADGSVRTIDLDRLPEASLKAAITADGGEVVDLDDEPGKPRFGPMRPGVPPVPKGIEPKPPVD